MAATRKVRDSAKSKRSARRRGAAGGGEGKSKGKQSGKPGIEYSEAVISNIIANGGASKHTVPDEALLFGATVSALGSNINDMHYKAGMSVGKSLYKVSSAANSYSSTEESVDGLVSFLKAAGHKNTTYQAFPDKVEITMHRDGAPKIGANLHSFEAGVMSGYLSASERRHVPVSEVACAHNGSDRCRFATVSFNRKPVPDSRKALSALAEHIAENSRTANYYSRSHGEVSHVYHSLSAPLLGDREYSEQMKSIAGYLGNEVGGKLFNSYNKNRHGNHVVDIAHTIRLLNFGNPIVESILPFHMSVAFDELNSKKEFVDVAMSFIDGLIMSGLRTSVQATERVEDGSYVVDIKETNLRERRK
jgi:predicted hydrocarbon binding protein